MYVKGLCYKLSDTGSLLILTVKEKEDVSEAMTRIKRPVVTEVTSSK